MHNEILSKKQIALLPLLDQFSSSFTLVGGTAISLQLGHRRSIDFDLFSQTDFDSVQIRGQLGQKNSIQQTIIDSQFELTVIVDGVKLTFYRYPYKIEKSVSFDDRIMMPTIQTLAAMKAFALGRRAKWKDYVDLYFVFQHHSFDSIVDAARQIFKNEFNEKLFRAQLSYFQDIDYTEEVDFMITDPPSDKKIQDYLQKLSIN